MAAKLGSMLEYINNALSYKQQQDNALKEDPGMEESKLNAYAAAYKKIAA